MVCAYFCLVEVCIMKVKQLAVSFASPYVMISPERICMPDDPVQPIELVVPLVHCVLPDTVPFWIIDETPSL